MLTISETKFYILVKYVYIKHGRKILKNTMRDKEGKRFKTLMVTCVGYMSNYVNVISLNLV